MENAWEKLACALLAAALLLAGWGLWKVDIVDDRTARIETAIGIYHQKVGAPDAMQAGRFVGYSCEERLDFLQLSSLKAYNSIKQRDYDAALRTIMLGLDESGLHCKEHRGSLRCE